MIKNGKINYFKLFIFVIVIAFFVALLSPNQYETIHTLDHLVYPMLLIYVLLMIESILLLHRQIISLYLYIESFLLSWITLPILKFKLTSNVKEAYTYHFIKIEHIYLLNKVIRI